MSHHNNTTTTHNYNTYNNNHHTSNDRRWVPVFDGIVVPTGAAISVVRGYMEWCVVRRREEEGKRRRRALAGWRLLISKALATHRIFSSSDTFMDKI